MVQQYDSEDVSELERRNVGASDGAQAVKGNRLLKRNSIEVGVVSRMACFWTMPATTELGTQAAFGRHM